MPDEFFASLEGLDETSRAFATLIASLTDLRPFWPKVVPLFIGWMREQFDSEGAWGGEKWEPLSPEYLARKMVRYPGKPILQASGDLRQAVSRPLRRATPSSLTLVVDDALYKHGGKKPRAVAPFHQFGGDSEEIHGIAGRPPKRPIIPEELPLGAEAEFSAVVETYVVDLARRVGLPVEA